MKVAKSGEPRTSLQAGPNVTTPRLARRYHIKGVSVSSKCSRKSIHVQYEACGNRPDVAGVDGGRPCGGEGRWSRRPSDEDKYVGETN